MITAHRPSLSGGLYGIPVYGAPLPGAKIVSLGFPSLAIGNTDSTTVPTGKCWFVVQANGYNASLGTVALFLQALISGTRYRFSNTNSAVSGAIIQPSTGVILQAGEAISVNAATTAGLHLGVTCIEFDATAQIKGPRVLNSANGDNLLYTCPSGYTAILLQANNAIQAGATGSVQVFSDGGGTRTYKGYNVPNGQAVGATYQHGLITAAADSRGVVAMDGGFAAGDTLHVDVSATGCGLWGVVLETPL